MRSPPERLRQIERVSAQPNFHLRIEWVGGPCAEIDMHVLLGRAAKRGSPAPNEFERVRLAEWGHGVEWPSGAEIGADRLWLETLAATGHKDARTFLEWRYQHGLSLDAAARALGVSRRTVAYYSSGQKPVPRHILLACLGWEQIVSPAERPLTPVQAEVRDLIPA